MSFKEMMHLINKMSETVDTWLDKRRLIGVLKSDEIDSLMSSWNEILNKLYRFASLMEYTENREDKALAGILAYLEEKKKRK